MSERGREGAGSPEEGSELGDLCAELLEEAVGADWRLRLRRRSYVVCYVEASGAFSALAREVEERSRAEGADPPCTWGLSHRGAGHLFVLVVAARGRLPEPVASLRLKSGTEGGLELVSDFVAAGENNPWRDELAAGYLGWGERYDEQLVWRRLLRRAGVGIDLSRALALTGRSALGDEAGPPGALSDLNVLLLHAALRYARATGKSSLLVVMEHRLLKSLERLGMRLERFEELGSHDTALTRSATPAFCHLPFSLAALRASNPGFFSVLVEGEGLDRLALLPRAAAPVQPRSGGARAHPPSSSQRERS